MTTQEVADWTGLSKQFFHNDRVTGKLGIPFVKIGRVVRYKRSDIEKFINEHTFRSTSEVETSMSAFG
ncbi:MAG: helix-turn-helix domain-containing protein [Methylocystaceae bacterium]|nr:helix-turn-helix domain-containing protein [Methylocystaceae bacterium]